MRTLSVGRLKNVGSVLMRFQSLFGLAAIVVLSAILSPIRNGSSVFLAPDNLLSIVRFASENGIIAVGMTLVILTGGIDLSVGAVLALCAVGAATCLTRYHLGTVPTALLMLTLGGLAGLINGTITTRLGIQSFITTLAMLSAARGAASLWDSGDAVPLAFGTDHGDAPPLFQSLFAGQVNLAGLEIPGPVFYFLAVGVLVSVLLRRTPFGRYVYAVGGNAEASRLSGIAIGRIQTAVFVISGLLAGLAALLHAALVSQGSHIDGNGYELNAIAAVVIGGTSLAGGTGTVAGSMIGALTLGVLDNILGLRDVQSEYQAILKGVIIVLAVLLQRQRRS